MTRMTLEEAYSNLSPGKLAEVRSYIGVIVPARDTERAWNWMASRVPDWADGKSYEEFHGPVFAPTVFHFLQEDKALAMEFKLTFGG